MAGNLPSDPEFDASVRRGLRVVREGRGDCPDAETLTKHAFGELAWDDAERARAHVERCGLCDAVLFRMKQAEAPEEKRTQWVEWIWNPALAYALAAVLAVPAYFGVRGKEKNAGVEAVAEVRLDATRGGEAPAAPRGEKFVARFFVPMKAGRTYRASVVDGAGKRVAGSVRLTSGDGSGNMALLVRSAHLAAGVCTVEVDEVDEAGSVTGTLRYAFRR